MNLLHWILDYLVSNYFHHVIQYSLQSSDNEFYNFNLSILRENNLLKMTKIIQSVLFWKNTENSSAELSQDEATTQKEFSNFIDSQEEELCLLQKQHEQNLCQLALLQICQNRDEIWQQIKHLVIEEHSTSEDQKIQKIQKVDSHTFAKIKHSHRQKNSLLSWNRFCTWELSLYKKLFLKKYKHFIQICEKNF